MVKGCWEILVRYERSVVSCVAGGVVSALCCVSIHSSEGVLVPPSHTPEKAFCELGLVVAEQGGVEAACVLWACWPVC